MSNPPLPLTERQRFWLAHLRRCGTGSLGAYAAEHGLSAGSLYEARSRLRRRGLLDAPAPVRLVRIERSEPAASEAGTTVHARITLGNGVLVELAVDPEHWPALLAALAALP
ncbi:MAG: hypothetical protein KIS73_30235 [Enhydrobacter sp.]|nr:hypothetical protein [Enhydrobacter sp.]